MRAFVTGAGERSLVAFTSASAVRAYVEDVGIERARRVTAASIGPTTSAAARDAGLDVRIEATRSTMPALVEAIIAHAND